MAGFVVVVVATVMVWFSIRVVAAVVVSSVHSVLSVRVHKCELTR
jgi:hypothetical protein